MDLTAEIKSKEKSLSDLMVRVLRGPLNPLEDSLKTLKDDLLDTKDLVSEVNDAVHASVQDFEKIHKALKKIRDDSLPEMASSIKATLSDHVGSESRQITAMLAEVSSSLSREVGAARAEQVTLVQAAIAEVRLNREREESANAEHAGQLRLLALESKRACVEIAAALEGLHRRSDCVSTALDKMEQENCRIAQGISVPFERGKAAMMETMAEQRQLMLAEFSLLRAKMKTLAITSGAILASVLAYVGYDLYSKF